MGERKAVTSGGPVLKRRKGCGARQGIDPGRGENGLWGVERRGARRFRMQCSVPSMPVVNKAGNQVTWNHFFFELTLILPGLASFT